MPKERRIRVRGVPRKDIDLHLLAQALVMIGEDLRQEQEGQQKAGTGEEEQGQGGKEESA